MTPSVTDLEDGSGDQLSWDEASYSPASPPHKPRIRFFGTLSGCGKVLKPAWTPNEKLKMEASQESTPIKHHISPPPIKRTLWQRDRSSSLSSRLTLFPSAVALGPSCDACTSP
uniref:Uncharacterized protein n=1 Tax=Oryza punctata TaxID=4537 RepID=A0A0E0MLC9_ORYPU